MISLLISLIGIFFTIFFVVGTHEYAHFLAARLLGVKVLRYSIGFGKTLYRWFDKKGTEYVIALIPLGGYVKMLDENEENVPPNELAFAFNRQPFYKKFLIVLAGPLMNLFCALILYWIIFMIGFTTIKPIIGPVTPHSIAAEGGLKPRQEILRIDDKKVLTWSSVLFRLLVHAGNGDEVKIDVINPINKKPETHILNLANWKIDSLNPEPLASLGIAPYEPNIPLIIGVISAESPASHADLKIGDKIIAINQKPIKNWEDLITTISKHPEETLTFTIERESKVKHVPITIGYKQNWLWEKSGYLGIAPHFQWPNELLHKIKYGPVEAFIRANQEIIDFTYFNLLIFGKLITGKLSLQSLGGPITIFQSAGTALNFGLLAFLGFLAFLSISIGIINLFPIPGLDGGHLFIQIVELIIRRPVPNRVLLLLFRLGFIILILILIQALMNDLLRLF